MAQIPRELAPGRSAHDLFGAELRRWRCKRELSQAALAEGVLFSSDLIAKVEKAERWPQRDFAEACDAVLDTDGALARLWPLVEREHREQVNPADARPEEAATSPLIRIDPDGYGLRAHTEEQGAGIGGAGLRPWSGVHRPVLRAPIVADTWAGIWRNGPSTLEEQLVMSARKSAEYADDPSNVGPAVIEQLRAEVTRLARSFPNAPRYQVFGHACALRDRSFALLDGRQRVSESHDLYFLAGAACGMLAEVTLDFGFHEEAMAHTRTALLCATQAGHAGLTAWIRGEQSNIAYCAGRPQHAVQFARTGQDHAIGGTVSAWLPALEARSASRLADAEATRAALVRVGEAREQVRPDELDEIGGILAFPVPKQHFYGAESYLGIGAGAEVATEAELCIIG